VTIEIDTEHARLLIRGDLTVAYSDGRTEVVEERRATPTGRAYWGVSHELLVADFYRRLHEPEPFWIGPAEGLAALAVLDQVYRDAGVGADAGRRA
jgi:UDP-N-acetyl-2-amino-2-deoxyglucuronate dehydrogenase